jgi:hypothetical protein
MRNGFYHSMMPSESVPSGPPFIDVWQSSTLAIAILRGLARSDCGLNKV